MRLNDLLGGFTALSFAVPVFIIFFLGLFVNKSLLALALYCTIAVIFNALNAHLWMVGRELREYAGIVSSYTDAPLMLALLALYCHTRTKKRVLLALLALYLVYELAVVLFVGINPISTVYTSGVGLLLVFGLGIYFFVAQLKHTVRFNKGMGRTLIAAGIFFGYGLYTIVYFLQCIYEAPEIDDIILLYQVTGIIFSGLITAGLLHLWRRHRQIQQLLVVRRELKEFFAQ